MIPANELKIIVNDITNSKFTVNEINNKGIEIARIYYNEDNDIDWFWLTYEDVAKLVQSIINKAGEKE